MDFVGAAAPLSTADIAECAKLLGVPENVVRAVVKVEANGKAFNSDGTPVIAWEPHIFYRYLPKDKRHQAVSAGLAHPKWGVLPYLSSQSARYRHLRRAMTIDRDAALQACSWGAPQIMAFNYKTAGFSSLNNFVEAMKTSAGEQIKAMARFIKNNNAMHAALRRQDWHGFARRYNGSGYTKNRYAAKLERWAGHYKGRKLASEVERIEKHPEDPENAREEVKKTVKNTIGVTTYLTIAWNMLGDAREVVDTAIHDLTGLKGMAPWVADAILVLASVSAGLVLLGIIRTIIKKGENKRVAAENSA